MPVHAIGVALAAMDTGGTENVIFDLVSIEGATFLRVWPSGDPEIQRRGFGAVMRRAKMFATGLSIATFGHVWVEPVILDHERRVLWTEPKVLSLIVDKEVDPSGPQPLQLYEYVEAKQLVGWISAQYPQVLVFHYAGLFLLRSSLGYDSADYFHAEALTAFYKMAEAVVSRRTGDRSPDLTLMQKVAAELKVSFDPTEIKALYIARGEAGAHGNRLVVLTRAQAVEAKLFADMMVWKDYLDRRDGGIAVGGPLPHRRTDPKRPASA